MAKNNSTTIWRVSTGDQNYQGHNFSFLMTGKTAASVEQRAIKLAKKEAGATLNTEPKSMPYVRSIELVGELAD